MIPGETVTSRKSLGLDVDPHISSLQVMSTPAGYYVGTIYTYCDCAQCQAEGFPDGFTVPNSRETDYVKTRAQAEKILAAMQADEAPPELRTETFNKEGAQQIEAIALPADATGEDIYRMLHGDDEEKDDDD